MKIAAFLPATLLLVYLANGAHSAQAGVGIGIDTRQNFFNVELLQVLNDFQPGNTIVGTSSVKACLMLLVEAAQGRTRQEILTALRLPSNLNDIRSIASRILSSYTDPKGNTELLTAAKLWSSKDVLVNQNYSLALQRYYNSAVESVNFKDSKSAIASINSWVKNNTHGLIEILYESASDLPAETKMVLTTTSFFKGKWVHAFDLKATRLLCFKAPTGCSKTNMMENIAWYKYGYIPALDAEVAMLPYMGENFGMVVMLPKRSGAEALNGLSRNLAFIPMSIILSSLQDTELRVQLPRFTINNEIELAKLLDRLGMRDMFSSNADLSGAFNQNNTSGLRVGSVLHKARIEVSEEGTVAAAVTGTSVIPLMGVSYTDFICNRPFMYFLVNTRTSEILFAGRFVDPTQTVNKS